MAIFQWTDDYRTGLDAVDRQHQRLVAILNGQDEARAMCSDSRMVLELLGGLAAHTQYHFDGSGMPNGLVGEAIPLGARILSVVRDYDLFLEGRISGKPMTASEAQDQVRRLRGRKFDPRVVNALLHLVGEVKDTVYRPVIEASPVDLMPGMDVVEVTFDGKVFLRDVVLTAESRFGTRSSPCGTTPTAYWTGSAWIRRWK